LVSGEASVNSFGVAMNLPADLRLHNDADKTFEWLDHAWSYRDPAVHYLPYDPFIGRFKSDPRPQSRRNGRTTAQGCARWVD
jgi:hypothetical protein